MYGKNMEKKIIFNIDKNTDTMMGESFWIPRSSDALFIEFESGIEYGVMGYVALRDEKKHIRLQKLIGYGPRKLWVGKDSEHTSIGGVPGRIEAGKWELSLYLFTEYIEQALGEKSFSFILKVGAREDSQGEKEVIEECIGENCWVGVSQDAELYHKGYDWTKEYQKGRRWYKGDFHTHTRLSDGKETVRNAMKKAKDMRLDFYVPTEHNVIHTGWIDTDIMIVPGVEITTEKGHFNLFGIDRFPRELAVILGDMASENTEKYVNLILEEAEERGWLVSINHPFLYIWKWKYERISLEKINCIEIINDPTYTYAKNSNQRAIEFLDWLWQDGYRIWGVGGSDSHNLINERYDGASEPSVAGDPGTYIYMDVLTPKHMLSALRQGHVYVSRYCVIDIRITAKDLEGREYLYYPGDEILCDQQVKIQARIEISGLPYEPVVYKVENRVRSQIQIREKRPSVYVAEAESRFYAGEWQWLRFDIKDKNENYIAYVNPVYCGRKEHSFHTYGQALKAMEEKEDGTGDII